MLAVLERRPFALSGLEQILNLSDPVSNQLQSPFER